MDANRYYEYGDPIVVQFISDDPCHAWNLNIPSYGRIIDNIQGTVHGKVRPYDGRVDLHGKPMI